MFLTGFILGMFVGSILAVGGLTLVNIGKD